MVLFKDLVISKKRYLLITDHDEDSAENDTQLLVHTPTHGRFAKDWSEHNYPNLDEWSTEVPLDNDTVVHSLKSLIHTEKPRTSSFQTLGHRIISGDTHWGSSLKLNGEFGFIEKYWEWLEDILGRDKQVLRDACLYEALYASLFTYDRNPSIIRAFCEAWCPETNTLHTSAGELSISLWDLYKIGGLPIIGGVYEEIIPSAEELTGAEDKRTRYIPQSCEYLFAAFRHLQNGENHKCGIPVDQWINFWFKGKSKYTKPKARRIKKASRPQATQNPTGEIGPSRKFLSHDNNTFDTIGVKAHLREETYLAAFISCWLCVFALPNENLHVIRPTTFKMASMMACGRKTCLSMPILLSIYRGLNKIAHAPSPGLSHVSLPMHYVYAWLAEYFHTHYMTPNALPAPMMTNYSGEGGARYYDESDAHNLIHKGNKVNWDRTSLVKNRNEKLVDDGKLPKAELGYFLNVCSNYLVFHVEKKFLVEPYNQYRFSRQFGFYQDIPKELEADVRTTNYKLCRILWHTAIRCKTNAAVLFPASSIDITEYASPKFYTWWSKVHGEYLLEGQNALISSIQPNSNYKKLKGKELARVKSSRKDDGQETQKKTLASEEDQDTVSRNKSSTPKGPTSAKTPPKDARQRLSSMIVKAKDSNAANSYEKKRNNLDVEDGQSSNSERHWKRRKIASDHDVNVHQEHKRAKVILYAFDEDDLDPNKCFENIPDISIPDVSLEHIVRTCITIYSLIKRLLH